MRTKSFPTICGICLAVGEDLKMKVFYQTAFEKSVLEGWGARLEKVSCWACPHHDWSDFEPLVEANRGIVNPLPLPFEQLFTWI